MSTRLRSSWKWTLGSAMALAAVGVFAAGKRAQAEGETKGIVYVVDVSGSMAPVLGNVSRAICESVDSERVKPLMKSLVVFEGCGLNTARVAVPLAKDNDERLKAAAKAMRPGGATDILSGLARAKEVVQTNLERTGDCANVVLFTDDEDTCGNGKKHLDVIREMAKACAEKKAVFSVDVITSAKEEETKLYLEKLAEVGNGKVHGVVSLDEIGEALERIVESHRRRNGGVPLTSTQQKPESGGTTGTPRPQARPKPQEKPAPAQQGGEAPKIEEKKP